MTIHPEGEKSLCPVCARFVNAKKGIILPHPKFLANLDCVETKLAEILSTMDMPPVRGNDLQWMNRNLGIKNKNHHYFDLAMWCIQNLLSRERIEK